VDLLKIIQLGITLFNADGEVPPTNALEGFLPNGALIICPTTWTFNFKFNLDEEMYNEDSINLLKKAGCDFDRMAREGIHEMDFGALLISSGLSFSKSVHWISFHSGYDFGYVMKLMFSRFLPKDEDNYRRLLKKFFPNLWDIKFMLRHTQKLRDRGTVTGPVAALLQAIGTKSGLQDIADEVGCTRIGAQHTAGSDAWLTGLVFFELRRRLFDNGTIPEELNGQMWGITGVGPPASATAQAAALQNQAAMQNQAAASNSAGANGGGQAFTFMHREAAPSTPTTNPAGPAQQTQNTFQTNAGAGGVFGNFQYGK
jgi:CCR4-NOT transcription complex subunit 7/8